MQKIIPVFIASPGDVPQERNYAARAIHDLSSKLLRLYGVVLAPIQWEDLSPVASENRHQPFQHRINQRLETCAIFIGILYGRYGTEIDEEQGASGTEAEFRRAIKHRKEMRILTYFRRCDQEAISTTDHERISQHHKLEQLRSELQSHNIPFQWYGEPQEFGRRILLDLLEVVLEMVTEVAKREHLLRFFKFGIDHHRRGEPSVMIGYPAIHTLGGSTQVSYNWRERLLPHVVYEDFKTIQKIESTLRHIGMTDYSSVTLDHPKLADRGNRIWLCVPRNPEAQKRLRQLEGRTRFHFVSPASGARYLEWRPHRSDETFQVRSPLSKYLAFQRPAGKRAWDPKYGGIFGRDYAIIARFASGVDHDPFYQYFMAGIRGLGTWGTGWFIDRHPRELSRMVAEQSSDEENGDVQALLEVTYENYRLIHVCDVSRCDQSYFDRQMEDAFIEKAIEDHRLR